MINIELPEDLTQILDKIIDYHKINIKPRKEMLYEYYNGNHVAINNKRQESRHLPNNKIVNPYPRYIVNTIKGYFLGKPVRYDIEDSRCYEVLDDIFDNNYEDDINIELEKTLSIMGEAFELVFINEDKEIKIAQLPPLNTIAIYDDSITPKLSAVIRYYEVSSDFILNNKPKTTVEVYLSDRIDRYTKLGNNGFVLEESEPHYFGEVPVTHYMNNEECLGDFECALSQIDAYDKLMSTNLDEIQKFAQAYLIMEGLDGTDDDEIAEALKKRTLKVPHDAKMSWLTKDLSNTSVFEQLKVLDEKIHTMAQVPNMSDDNFASNASGVAMEFKLIGFENLISAKERKFEQGLKHRLKLIISALNLKGQDFDWKAIKIAFDRNLPKNILEASQIIANLKDVIPAEELIVLLPFIQEPRKLAKKIKNLGIDNQNTTVSDNQNIE